MSAAATLQRWSARLASRSPLAPVAIAGSVGVLLSIGAFVLLRAGEGPRLRDDVRVRTGNLMSSLRTSMTSEVIALGVACLERMTEALQADPGGREWTAPAASCVVRTDFYSSSLFWAPLDRASGEVTVAEVLPENGPSSHLAGASLSGDPVIEAALRASRITGRSAFLARIPLESEREAATEWIDVRPVASSGGETAGFAGIHVVTRVDRMAESVVGGLDVLLVEEGERPVPRLAQWLPPSPWRFESRLRTGGRVWRVIATPRSSLVDYHRTATPWHALGIGVLATLLLCELLRRAISRRRLVEELVEQRTAELHAATRSLREKILESELRLGRFQESEERFRALFEKAPDAYFLCDSRGAFIDVNRAGEALVGRARETLVGTTVLDLGLVGIEEIQRTARLLSDGGDGFADSVELSFRRESDGAEVFVEVRLQNVKLRDRLVTLGLCRDVTERRRLELEQDAMREQLLNAQKMEAIGQLAGGIAHDFNNVLACIRGHAELLQSAELADEARVSARAIEAASQRAAELTGQLLGFARRGKQRNVPVDVHSLIQDAVGLLGRTLPKTIHIAQRLDARQPVVEGDPSQLQQVILNLAINARDAMPEGGRLIVETAVVGERGGAPGEVVLAITDTGTGIPPEVQERMFEPFFTTKPVGKGTGMGLAMVYGIVQNHGGRIEVRSRPDEGTTVRLILPRHAEPAEPVPAPELPLERTPELPGLRVMAIDDDPAILGLVRTMLGSLGCQVVGFERVPDAIAWYATHGSEIDVVLIDLTMPPPDGRECFRFLRDLDPGVKVAVVTGHGDEGLVQELLDTGVLAYLHKPFSRASLARLVEAVAGATTGARRGHRTAIALEELVGELVAN